MGPERPRMRDKIQDEGKRPKMKNKEAANLERHPTLSVGCMVVSIWGSLVCGGGVGSYTSRVQRGGPSQGRGAGEGRRRFTTGTE